MTPLLIEIVLHYHCRADDYRGGDYSAPAVREGIDWLRDEARLIEFVPEDARSLSRGTWGYIPAAYRLTERGKTYVEALQSMPLPVQVWVMPKEEAA